MAGAGFYLDEPARREPPATMVTTRAPITQPASSGRVLHHQAWTGTLGVGTIVFAAVVGADAEGWLHAGAFAGLLLALGVLATRTALRFLAAPPARRR